MTNNDTNTFAGKTSDEWLAEARRCNHTRDESWDRCDTDGYLSQWANGVMASRYRHLAEIAARGGYLDLPALFTLDGDLIIAREVNTRYGWRWVWTNDYGTTTWFNESSAQDPIIRRRNNARKGVYLGTVRYQALLNHNSMTTYPGEVLEIIDNGH